MVKLPNRMKEAEVEQQIEQALYDLLRRVPGVEVDRHPSYPQLLPSGSKPDIRLRVSHRRSHQGSPVWDSFDLIGEVKSNGQPRVAQSAIFQLRTLSTNYNTPILLIFAAPFISKDVRDLCIREDIGYVDLAGNARIAFNGVYIEREAADNPYKEVRENRSLFAPKAARILRAMYWDVKSPWRVATLAEAANVSFGQVSNIGTALEEAGYAEKTDQGIFLTEPGKLLDAWAKAYRLPDGRYESFYTTLHGKALTDSLRGGVLGKDGNKGRAVLANTSAAEWLAPFVRSGTGIAYADDAGLANLKSTLDLKTVDRGYNMLVKVLADDGPLDDAFQVADGIWCTSPTQTYLDLSYSGDRNQEAAAALDEKWFPWH